MIGSAALVSATETTGRKASQRPELSEIDLNGDGLISKTELMAHAKARGGNMFDKLDTDNDGQLDAEEFSKGRKRGGKGKKRAKRTGSNNGDSSN